MYQLYYGQEGYYGTSISIDGVGDFYVIYGADGLYTGAVSHQAKVAGSPLVIEFDGTGVNLGDLFQAIITKLPK